MLRSNREGITALLPMKGHSERVPGKNFRVIAGKPLFRWVLDALLETPAIDRVVINTDARERLQDAGLPSGDRIIVRDRPPHLCGDMVSMNSVLEDDIRALPGSIYVMTHTTNPLLTAATIQAATETYRENPSYDSLFSVNRIQTRFYRENGDPVNHDPRDLIRTQDLEPWFEENSCLYVFSEDSFLRHESRIGSRPRMFQTPPLESVDIDLETDWIMAESLLTTRKQDLVTNGNPVPSVLRIQNFG